MKGVIVRFDAPKVRINGAEYDVQMDQMEMHAKSRRYMAQVVNLNVHSEDAIRDCIAAGCALVDDALGEGAMAKIAAGKPISLNKAVQVLNAIVDAVNDAYSDYVSKTYGGGV